jgi:uncharacterized protein
VNVTAAPAPRPLPVADDVDTGGFWAAAASDRLAICVCGTCDAVLHLPRAYCHSCGQWNAVWREVSGRATIYSWTIVEHQVHPAFPVPYALVLVEIDELPDVRLLGHMPGRPPLAIGMAVEAYFEHLEGGTVLPEWRLVDGPTESEEVSDR